MEVERWSGLGVEVSWRFGSTLALPASHPLDGNAEVLFLSFNGVTLMWIDVGEGLWVVWKDRGVVVGWISVTLGVISLAISALARPAVAVSLWLGSYGDGSWCRLAAYSGFLPCWLVLRPCWVALCFNLCIVFWLCLFPCCVLFALLVVDFGYSSCDCPVLPCWWDMPLRCDNPVLGRQRVIANWTLPPSGRMRYRVAGINSVRPHTGIAVGIPVFMRLSDVVFPVGDRFFKAVDVDISVLRHASRCLFEYVDVLETPFIGLLSFIILGFRLYVPPMYFNHR